MRKKELIDLLERYEQMLVSGQSLYFDADQYDSLAEYYDRLDDLEKARSVVLSGLKIHPNNELLLLKNAKFFVYDSLYTKALEYLNIHFSAYDYDLYMLKVECYLHLGLYAEAYELTEEILNDDDIDLGIALYELGIVYLEANYEKEAILYFEKSLDYNPQNKDVLSDLAYAYEDNEDPDNAILIANRILDLDPYNSEFWLFLGKIYIQIGNYEMAIDAFDFVSTIEGDDVSYLKLKAHCLVLVDRISEAIDVLLLCIEDAPYDEYLYISLVDCFLNLDKYDEILKVVDRFEKDLEEHNPVLSAKKAYAYYHLGHIEQALSYIDIAVEKDSMNFDVNISALDIYIKSRMYAEALQACHRLLIENGDDIDILEKGVNLSVQIQDFQQAIIFQKQIIEIESDDQALQKLALLYLENNDKEKFTKLLYSFNDKCLYSYFCLFYEKDLLDVTSYTREFLIKQLLEAFNCRVFYKGIKY